MPANTGLQPILVRRKWALAWRALVPAPQLFAVIFFLIWLAHLPVLRLPYFWDEAGYYVPAARDLLLTGSLIPVSTISNAHPPLVMAWLALCWKVSAFTPAVTHTAMLLVAAFALLGVFRLARQVSNVPVAVASTVLTAIYPVFFAQSSLAHLDMAAAGLTLWGLSSYMDRRWWPATVWFALAGMAKETALVTPLALLGWELLLLLVGKFKTSAAVSDEPEGAGRTWRPMLMLVSVLPLAAWLAYHYFRTGVVFGNPGYFRYNVGATMHPLRFAIALGERLWQLLGYLNMFVLTGAAALAMRYPQVTDSPPRLAPNNAARTWGTSVARTSDTRRAWSALAVVICAYLVLLASVGGALLARYLLPVYPLVVIACVSALARRLSWWPWAVGVAAVAFVIGWFSAPYHISPEDNLSYTDFIRLHQMAEQKIAALPDAYVLTAWPASDELTRPYLEYVERPVPVVAIENFTLSELLKARQHQDEYNYALVFSTKYTPTHGFFPEWWESLQMRYFDYHRDLPPEAAAQVLGGRLIYQARRGGEWVAIIAFDE
jgi:hypothetical protein